MTNSLKVNVKKFIQSILVDKKPVESKLSKKKKTRRKKSVS
jgi:hypothetical protein